MREEVSSGQQLRRGTCITQGFELSKMGMMIAQASILSAGAKWITKGCVHCWTMSHTLKETYSRLVLQPISYRLSALGGKDR